jgi:hypothetical protein
MMRAAMVSLFALALLGCGERSQSQADARDAGDTPDWQGAKNEFVAKGWTPGNKAAWELQLRNRAQTQNEYTKVN